MNKLQKILIVDDDPEICQLIKDYLHEHGFDIAIANDGASMQHQLKEHIFDLILLDINLPDANGIWLCQEIAKHAVTPIIIISAIGEESDRVMALEIGADDFLEKPFSLRELLARVRSLLRRSAGKVSKQRALTQASKQAVITFANFTIEVHRRRLLSPDGVVIPLTRAEYDLLMCFVEHPKQVLTRDQLLDAVSGRELAIVDRTIDVLVGRLRKKIQLDATQDSLIVTERGIGYQLNVEVSS